MRKQISIFDFIKLLTHVYPKEHFLQNRELNNMHNFGSNLLNILC